MRFLWDLYRLKISIALANHSLDLFAQLRGSLSPSLSAQLILLQTGKMDIRTRRA